MPARSRPTHYIPRAMERTLDWMLGQGKVVLLTGARQVGKTTMLQRRLGGRFGYVTLDDMQQLALARQDAPLFFQSHQWPLIIDEVQRAPELFGAVKLLVDADDAKGQVVLTGSQTYHLMKGVSESLAGRIRILEMPGLSLRELSGDGAPTAAFIPPAEVPAARDCPVDLWAHIQRGSLPELQDAAIDWDAFYTDYVRSYLERDVRDLVRVQDEIRFYNFMVACAARTAQVLNFSDIAATADIDQKTAKAWLSILQASGIVHVLQPFFANISKRVAKTPKLYFLDTGLVCHLARWTSPEALRNGAQAGHIFETFAVSETLKSHMNAKANLRDIWFYRDSAKNEIDLVIQQGRVLHPVEIKMAAAPRSDAADAFRLLDDIPGYERGAGAIICQTEKPRAFARGVVAMPVWAV